MDIEAAASGCGQSGDNKMKEWHRTIILMILLATAISFIIYLRTGYEQQAIHTLG